MIPTAGQCLQAALGIMAGTVLVLLAVIVNETKPWQRLPGWPWLRRGK